MLRIIQWATGSVGRTRSPPSTTIPTSNSSEPSSTAMRKAGRTLATAADWRRRPHGDNRSRRDRRPRRGLCPVHAAGRDESDGCARRVAAADVGRDVVSTAAVIYPRSLGDRVVERSRQPAPRAERRFATTGSRRGSEVTATLRCIGAMTATPRGQGRRRVEPVAIRLVRAESTR